MLQYGIFYYLVCLMALIVEDGTGVAGANSYNTDAEYVAYALATGKTIGVDETARDIEQINGTAYLETLRDKYQGTKTLNTYSLQFPRDNVYIDGYIVANDIIHPDFKKAQLEAAIFTVTSSLQNNSSINNVKSQELANTGKIEYFEGGTYTIANTGTLDALLKPFLKGGFGLGVAKRGWC